MSSRYLYLHEKGMLNSPPKWLRHNVCYETIMGSIAYGVSSDNSDEDIYGFCIPPKEEIFPEKRGLVPGFDDIQRFDQYQQHGINKNNLIGNGKVYDITIFNIVKYFRLLMDNNPNCVDAIFTPNECVVYTNSIGQMVRERRKLFLHKGCWHKLKGYSYSQLHKARNVQESVAPIRALEESLNIPHSTTFEQATKLYESDTKYARYYEAYKEGMNKSRRFEDRKIKNMDSKFMYHVVRLLYAAEEILTYHDYNMTKNREHLKAIRRGDVSEKDIRKWAEEKEKTLEKLYEKSTLRYKPDVTAIRELLLNCLEHHYGSLKEVERPDKYKNQFMKIKEIVEEI